MPLCSALMRRPRFRLWIVSIPCCRSRRDASSAMVSSTIGTERYRSMLPGNRHRSRARQDHGTAHQSGFRGSRFTSFSIISQRTKHACSMNFFTKTLGFSSISLPHTLHGSIRSSFCSARSSATSLLAASSPLSLAWHAKSNDTSGLTNAKRIAL